MTNVANTLEKVQNSIEEVLCRDLEAAAEEFKNAQTSFGRNTAMLKIQRGLEAFARYKGIEVPQDLRSKPAPVKMRRSVMGAIMGEPKRPVRAGEKWDLLDWWFMEGN